MPDPLDQPESDAMELVMPFVAVTSVGGPYDDQAFVAGYQTGQIYQVLTVGASMRADGFTFTVLAPLAKQMDLIARGET